VAAASKSRDCEAPHEGQNLTCESICVPHDEQLMDESFAMHYGEVTGDRLQGKRERRKAGANDLGPLKATLAWTRPPAAGCCWVLVSPAKAGRGSPDPRLKHTSSIDVGIAGCFAVWLGACCQRFRFFWRFGELNDLRVVHLLHCIHDLRRVFSSGKPVKEVAEQNQCTNEGEKSDDEKHSGQSLPGNVASISATAISGNG